MEAIGEARRRACDARAEAQASSALKAAILSDLRELQAERERVVAKLASIKDGLKRIESEKTGIMPVGKRQSELLGKAHSLIKEAHNRMELSIILNK
ncbi:magnetosome protein Mad26 [Fundidesulfovibrio magnetotacticus]|uniref:Magnetosome protein Mad26 n=2 Tax=Fundidesulfovibrio magnetotacticus TaxID=2730080 RepID=A0A6V8LKV5_9BACT|nr:magnetosome protein Mad26 [Fundidesulfovibrio magnetotacticus]